jgi:enoyl-CoA hydratase/carnithine racemase
MSQTPPTLSLEIRDSLAFLTLARPEAANTMNLQFGRATPRLQ